MATPNYELEIIHTDGTTEKFHDTFTGPHDAMLSVASTTLDARLEELQRDPAQPDVTRMRLTLHETPLQPIPPASFTYNYELYFDHRAQDSTLKTMHMFNGPHDARFEPVPGKLAIQLRHLSPDPLNQDALRLVLVLTETP